MKLIFDIGFNKGEFTAVCIEKYPACEVVGVEANMDLFHRVRKKPYLTLLHKLVSHKDGEKIDFFIEFGQDGISTASQEFMQNSRFKKGSKYLSPNSAQWINMGKVETITLDTLIDTYGSPDVIKIDVEGYEYNVIAGLNKKAGKICFECHEEEKEKLHKTIKHLRKIDYNKFGFIGYFEEGDSFEKLTYSEVGDPYLIEPRGYFPWEEIESDLKKCFNPERRVNYGMIWCK